VTRITRGQQAVAGAWRGVAWCRTASSPAALAATTPPPRATSAEVWSVYYTDSLTWALHPATSADNPQP